MPKSRSKSGKKGQQQQQKKKLQDDEQGAEAAPAGKDPEDDDEEKEDELPLRVQEQVGGNEEVTPCCRPEWVAAGWRCPRCQGTPPAHPEWFEISEGKDEEICEIYDVAWAPPKPGGPPPGEERPEGGKEQVPDRATRVPGAFPGYRLGMTQTVPPPPAPRQRMISSL